MVTLILQGLRLTRHLPLLSSAAMSSRQGCFRYWCWFDVGAGDGGAGESGGGHQIDRYVVGGGDGDGGGFGVA